MTDKTPRLARFDQSQPVLAQLRAIRDDLEAHRRDDRSEFDALRQEHEQSMSGLRLQFSGLGDTQTSIAANQQTILNALGLAAHDESQRRRGKPVALMGQWEGLLKLAGAFGGLVLMLRMIEAAWPGLWGMLKALGHAILAMNHAATG